MRTVKTDAWNPTQYEKFKNERSQPFFDLMQLLQPLQNARVIDLGCGTGELTSELHKYLQAYETIGVDSSDAMLAKAQTFENEKLHFKKVDIQNWQEANSFDIVFSNAAIQWCSDHKSIFTRIKSSLKENGQIAIQMPMNQDYVTHLIAYQMSQQPPWNKLVEEESSHMLLCEKYAELLFRLGFKEQKVFLRVYTHVLESREGVIDWVKGTLLTRFQSRLSEKDYAQFLKEFKENLFAKLPDEKPFFYPFKRILIWARK